MPKDHLAPKPEPENETPFQRFQTLAKRIIRAPKKKVTEQRSTEAT